VNHISHLGQLLSSHTPYATSGVSLSWYGFIPRELPITSSPATYSIDGQTPVNFLLKGLSSNATTYYNQKFFETPQLTAGPHTLKAVFQGNRSTPLTLDYLIVQNGTVSSTTTSGSSQATSSTTGNDGTSTSGKASTPVGAIVGGVIGGLALIAFVIFGFLFLRRRQKRVAQEKVFISTPKPFDYTPLHPSGNPSLSVGTSYSPVSQTTQRGIPVTKGHVYHASMPSVTSTEVSRSTGSPSTSSGVTTYPTNLRPVPLQQTALTIANPVPSSLPSKLDREAEALAALRPQRQGHPPSVPASVQSNDTWSPSLVLHADSGIRMPSSTAAAGTSVMDVPPLYTPD